jgi:Protein kinase domain
MSDALTWSPTAASPNEPAASAQEDAQDHDALRPGTRIDEFEIVRVLGVGGFGIVYLALDQVLMRQVAIKEYMPSSLAGRGKGPMVSVRSASLVETFATGLESFFNEARMLASFDHPSLVKVHRFWKANGTAYMVMPYYPGQTLKQTRAAMPAAPDEAWLRALAEPLLGALETLHAQGVYHRDIAPDNILLLADGRPLLLDFGSARRVIGDRTQTLTAILKPNFAPIEQYADDSAMRQGPWTDLYALGATLHFVLTGQAPTPAVLRAVRDTLPPLANRDANPFPGVGDPFLAVVDWSLALAPETRPQTAGEMRRAIGGELVPPPPAARFLALPAVTAESGMIDVPLDTMPVAPRPAAAVPAEPIVAAAPRLSSRRGFWIAGAASVAVMLVAIAWVMRPAGSPGAAEDIAAAALKVVPVQAADAASRSSASVAAGAAAASMPLGTNAATATTAAVAAAPASAAHKPPPAASAAAAAVAVAAAARRPRIAEAPAASAPATAAAVVAATHDAGDFCSGMNFFSRTVCLTRECRLPQNANQPQCVAIRRTDEERQQSMERH